MAETEATTETRETRDQEVSLDGRYMPGVNSKSAKPKLAMLVSPTEKHGRAWSRDLLSEQFLGIGIHTDDTTSASVLLSLSDMLPIWAIGTCASIPPIAILLRMTLDVGSECASNVDLGG